MSASAGSASEGARILARLDRLPTTRTVWMLVVLISLGGVFEFYDLFMMGYVIPGLVKAKILVGVSVGIFHGPALFVAATFAGLFIGTIGFGYVADKYGRRSIFTFSLVWYCIATLIMAFQNTGNTVCIWRLIASVGLGVELVTIDTYIAELMPRHVRGRAFAFNQFVTFCVVPIVAFISYLLVPITILGLDGWRWVSIIGAIGAIFVWFIRLGIPESPRWLINQGRAPEADAVLTRLEAGVRRDLGKELPPPAEHDIDHTEKLGRFGEIWEEPYRARTIMLMVFQFFQTFAYYGFAAWVPTLIAEQTGINIHASLLYAFIIAIANPFGPLIGMTFADKFERKWQLVIAAICIGIFGVLFAMQKTIPMLIVFGILITLSNNIMSYSFHSYQTELFPTRIRARAVGFTYSFSRISSVFVAFIIGAFLHWGGTAAVFGLIAVAMVIVVVAIGVFGPRTREFQLEQISH